MDVAIWKRGEACVGRVWHLEKRGLFRFIASLLLVVAFVGVALVVSGQRVSASGGFTLRAALRQAVATGPGFADVALQAEAERLTEALGEARRAPALSLSARTELHPVVRQRLNADVQWSFHEDFSVTVSVSTVLQQGAPPTLLGDGLRVGFSRTLWPGADKDAQADEELLEQRLARLDARNGLAAAYRDVIEAFGQLDGARRQERLAEQRLGLSRDRATMAADAFAAGRIGLRERQDAGEALRQAQMSLRDATTNGETAVARLQRLLGYSATGASSPHEHMTLAEAAPLTDDLPWADFMAAVDEVLAAPADERKQLFARYDVGYVTALHNEVRQRTAVTTAKDASLPQWRAEAQYNLPLAGAPGAGETPAGGAAAGGSSGGLVAFIGATWDLSGANRIEAQRAAVGLERAEASTRAALQRAEDTGEAAVRAVHDAAFALEVAATGLAQAEETLGLVHRRVELGFAGPLELLEAELDAERAAADHAAAQRMLHLAYFDLGHRLGLDVARLLH